MTPKKLKEDLKKTLKRGYATDNEELVAGLCCIASPVYNNADGAYYAISLSVPKARLWEVKTKKGHNIIRSVCQELSEKLGHVKTL